MIRSPMRRVFCAVLTAACILAWQSAGAVEFYWTGDISPSWSTNVAGNTNWATTLAGTIDPGALPTATSDVFFSKTGGVTTGTVTLDGAFSIDSLTFNSQQTGALVIAAGSGGNVTVGEGGLTVDAASADHTLSTGVTLGANQVWNIGANHELMVFGAVGGSANLTKSGVGMLVLSGVNSLTTTGAAGINVTGGVLSVNADAAFGNANNAITIDGAGATLRLTGDWNPGSGRTLTIGSGGGTLDVASGTTTFDDANQLAGRSGQFTKAGGGTLVLAAPNSFPTSGPAGINVTAGVLSINADAALGNVNNCVTISNGARLRTTASVILDGGRVVTIGSGGGTLDVAAGTLTFGTAGQLTGSGTMTKIGTGTLELGATTSFGGTTQVNDGVVRYSSAGSFSPNSNVTISGGVVDLNADLNDAAAGDFSAALGTGPGEVRWTASGGFAATTAPRTVNIGGAGMTLVWGGTANFVPDGSSLIFAHGGADNTLTFVNPIDLNGIVRTIDVCDGAGAIDAVLSGVLSGAAGSGLTKTGAGTLALSNANTFNTTGPAGITISGGVLSINADAALGNASNCITIDGAGATLRLTGDWNPGGTRVVTIGPGGGTLDVATGTTTFDDANQLAGTSGQFTKAGAGTLVLAAPNSFTTSGPAGITVTAGTLSVNGDNVLGNVNNDLTLDNGGVLATAADINFSAGRVLTVNAAGGAIDVAAGTTLTIDDASQLSLTGQLTKTGSGAITIKQPQFGAGGFRLSAGTVGIGASGVFGSGTLTLSGGTVATTVSGTGGNRTVGNNLLLNGAVTFGDASFSEYTLTFNGTTQTVDNNATIASTNNNGLSFTANPLGLNTGFSVSAGATPAGVTFSGGFTVNGGVAGANRTITLNNGAAAITISGPLAGTAANQTITLAGAGTNNTIGAIASGASTPGLIVNGSPNSVFLFTSQNTFGGGVTLKGGIAEVAADTTGTVTNGPFGTGTLTLSGGTLRPGPAADRTLSNSLTIGGGKSTLAASTAGGRQLTFSGPVTINGSPTLVFANDAARSFTYTHASIPALTADSGFTLVGNNSGGVNWGVTGSIFSLNGDVTVNMNNTGNVVFSTGGTGILNLNGASRTFTIDGTGAGAFQFLTPGVLTATAPGRDLVLAGSSANTTVGSFRSDATSGNNAPRIQVNSTTGGTFTFNGGNGTYPGGTLLVSGTLVVAVSSTVVSGRVSNGPLGTDLFRIQGGAIRADNTPRTLNNWLAIEGDFSVAAGGQLLTIDPTLVTTPPTSVNPAPAGSITLVGPRSITTSSNLALTGTITGVTSSSPSLTKFGPADLILIGGGTASTFDNLAVTEGRLLYDSQNALGEGTITIADGASLVKNSGAGALTLNNYTTTVNVGANISNRSGAVAPKLTLPAAKVQFPSAGRVVFNFDDQATAAIEVTGSSLLPSARTMVFQNGGNNPSVGSVTIPNVPLDGNRTLAFSGPGTTTISGQTLSADLTIAGNAVSGFVGLAPSGGGPVFGSGLNQSGTRAITIALALTGMATLPATDAGWTGGTTVRGGILAVKGGDTPGKKVGGGTVLLDGGFLRNVNADGENNDATYTDAITVSARGGGLEAFSSGGVQNVTFSGNISGSGPLTLRYGGSGSNNGSLILSGDNSTFASGFNLATTNGAGRVQFSGVNSTGAPGNTITVPGGIAFGFDSFATLTAGVLGMFATSPDAILVVDNYASSTIDLSSADLNKNVRIGSAGDLVFSGTLVSFASNYHLTPTSGKTLTFSAANQFTGSGNLDIRAGAIAPGAGAAATGTLVIAAANDFSGATTVSGIINNSLLGSGLTGTTLNLADNGKLSASSALTVTRGAQVLLTGSGATGQGQLGRTGVALKVNGGGLLRLGGATAASNDGVNDRVNSTGSVTLGDASDGGGTLTLALAFAGTHSQTLDSLTVARGGSAVNSDNPVAGTTTLTFGGAGTANYHRQAGGLVNFAIPTGTTNPVNYAAGTTLVSGVTSTNVAKGMPISGTGIAAGTYVVDFAGSTITLSQPTVTSGLSATLTYVVDNECLAFTNAPATTSVKGDGFAGILVGATINGTDLVLRAAGNIALPNYATENNQALWGTATRRGNVQTTGALSGAVSTGTINSLRIAGNSTVTINALNTLTIDSGMLVVAPLVSTGIAINGGALSSGNGQDLMVVNGSGQTLTIGSALTGGLPLTYASPGGGALILSNATNANAGLNALRGTIKISSVNAWGNPGQLFLDGGNIEYTAAADKSLGGGCTLVVSPNGGNLWNSSGSSTLTLADPITLNGALGVHGNSGSGKGTLAFNSTISGPGQIGLGAGGNSGTKFTLVLGGSNTAWSGGIRVDSSQFGADGSGTRHVRVASADGLGTGPVVLAADGLAAFAFAYSAGPATYGNDFLLNRSAPLVFWGLGPGLSTSGGTAVTTLSGKIAGLSGLNFQGYATADNHISELVLSGTVSTAGAPLSYSYGTATAAKNFNNAPGGITLGVTNLRGTASVADESLIDLPVGTATNGAEGFLRFEGANSLIPGAVGNGYVAALRKAGTGNDGRFGFLLTGGGTPYQLPEGKSFVIGSLGAGSQVGGTFGATGTGVNTATLIGSPSLFGEPTGTINIHADGQSDTQFLNLLARNSDDTLVLGQAGGAVVFSPTCGDSGAAVAPCYTLMCDRTGVTALNKVGAGTVEIVNVAYNNRSGASVRTSFTWNVNGGTLRYSQDDGVAADFSSFNVNSGGILAGAGKINAAVSVNAGGTLEVAPGANLMCEGVRLLGGTLSGSATLAMPITVITGGTLRTPASGDLLSFDGPLTIGGTLAKSGSGTVIVGGNYSHGGTVIVTAGTWKYQFGNDKSVEIDPAAALLIAADATVELGGSKTALSDGVDHVDLTNDSNTAGLRVLDGIQAIGSIDGSGTTTIEAGAELTASYVRQHSVILQGEAGHPAKLILRPSGSGGGLRLAPGSLDSAASPASPSQPVPEPGTLLLSLAALCLLACGSRCQRRKW